MDDAFLESLLYEGESSCLDYKREQYQFVGASKEAKSELLKDILAFANGVRRADAYILIGIEEVDGGRSNVVGVTNSLAESELQQFVNEKTNRTILFSHHSRTFDGKTIGIISIPRQCGPFYLDKDFGKLSKNTVYCRRGTSTAIASPTEIAEMGAAKERARFASETENIRNALSVSLQKDESAVDSFEGIYRLEVRNCNTFRTIDDVCIRILSLVFVEGDCNKELIPYAHPLLTITNTGEGMLNPPETQRSLTAISTVYFDFVRVRTLRRQDHIIGLGEYQRYFAHEGRQLWKPVYNCPVRWGVYRVCLEVQGRDVYPVRKNYVFWGDKTGSHCYETEDPRSQVALPLVYTPIDLDTLPPDMLPHHHRALERELRKSQYDDVSPDEVYLKIERDPMLCGLSAIKFVSEGDMQAIPEDQQDMVVVLCEAEIKQFPGGVPGFPNAIRRSDFDIAWRKVR